MKKRKKSIANVNGVGEQWEGITKKIIFLSTEVKQLQWMYLAIALIATVLCIVCFYKVHRIRSFSDVYEVFRVSSLKQYNYRCKIFAGVETLPSGNSFNCLKCLPNVLFIGASKAGTTSMTDYLSKHPCVHFTNRFIHARDPHREVHRFDRPLFPYSLRWVELYNEYAASPLLPLTEKHTDPVVIHYTPHYLYAPTVAYELRTVYPTIALSQMKFVVMLRDPVERALSSYWFKKSHHFTKFSVDEGDEADFQATAERGMLARKKYEICMNQTYPKASGIHDDTDKESVEQPKPSNSYPLIFKKCFGSELRSPRLGSRHIDKGIYVDQLERWFANFPPQYKSKKTSTGHQEKETVNYFIFTLEEFRLNPVMWYDKLLRFMNISDSSADYVDLVNGDRTVVVINVSAYKSSCSKISFSSNLSRVNRIDFARGRLSKPNARYRLRGRRRDESVPSRLRSDAQKESLIDNSSYSEFIDPHFLSKLKAFYRPYNARLERLLGRPLHWGV